MKLSIRLKFLMVMSGLLVVCLAVYLGMAITVFKSDKTELVYDLNRSQVSNLASEVETRLQGVSEKLKLFAQLPPKMQPKLAEGLFSDDSEVVAVTIFKADGSAPLKSFTQPKFLEAYGLNDEGFHDLLTKTPVPFKNILASGEDLWNASANGGPPLIGYGRLVVLQDEHGVPVDQWAVIAYLKLDRFLKSVSIVRLSNIVIANQRGEILIHQDAKSLAEKPSIETHPLFRAAIDAKTRLSVTNAEIDGGRWLAAHAKAFNGQVVVIARAPEREVFKVVRDLTTRTLLFGSIVLTLVILAAFLLSRSLTQNIAILSERMQKVSEGDLSTTIRLKGRDETVSLAQTFNQMIGDLKTSRDELERMNRELDQKVKDRTAQLEEQNLKVKEAQEALLRTTRLASVGELAGRTAHEVLNPLTSLLTRAGLMQKRVSADYESQLALLQDIRNAWKQDYDEGGFDRLLANWREPSKIDPKKTLFEEDIENLEAIAKDLHLQSQSISGDTQFIREEGSRIGKIINSMRRLGHVHSDRRMHSLHAVLSDCCHIMADLFDQHGFAIERDFQAQADNVEVDRDEFIQSVTNLMRNSLHAMVEAARTGALKDRARLRLSTKVVDGWIEIEIEDNGMGIAPEHQSQLFESSFTTKSPDEGTGLGLGISRRFIRAYGGDIDFVTSTPSQRTVFRIRMPIQGKQGVAA